MGDIGGELPPQLVPLFLLGHIQKHQHSAGGLSVGQHRVGQQLAVPAVQMEHLLAALAREGLVHRLAEGLLPVEHQHIDLTLRLLHAQQAQSARVVGEHVALPVQKQKALGHVVGESGKLGLPLLEQIHLLLDGVVLPLQAGDSQSSGCSRSRLRIGLISPLDSREASTAESSRDSTRMIKMGWIMEMSSSPTVF